MKDWLENIKFNSTDEKRFRTPENHWLWHCAVSLAVSNIRKGQPIDPNLEI